MAKVKIKWRNQHDGYLVENDGDVAKDGETVHTRMMMFDSMSGRRPGYATLTDEMIAKRQEARQGMIDRATSAWRMDAKRKPPDDDEDPDNDDDQDEQDARSRDARRFARRSQEGSRSGGPNQENNSHQGPQAHGSHDRLDGLAASVTISAGPRSRRGPRT
jgi:hypothetical protein